MKLSLFLSLSLLLSACSSAPAAEQYMDTKSSTISTEAEDKQDDLLNIYFFDIGQGDCTILTQGEHSMIIDAGDNNKGTAVQAYLEYLGIESLDYAILTHPDADHIGGMDVVLYKFDCDTILMPDKEVNTRTYDDVIQSMKSKNETAIHPEVGETYEFGDAEFTILAPLKKYSDNNNNSIVLRLTHGENTFLFTGDAEEPAEEDMLEANTDLKADVLKAGHHGSNTATSDAFLEAVSPDYAVISCGEGNKYGHPHAEVLNKFRTEGITIYRTDEQGTIVATSDGEAITWNTSPSDSWQVGEATASSQKETKKEETPKVTYVLNNSTKKFHLPDCRMVEKISDENKEETTKSKKTLTKEGYEACGTCKP